MKVFIIEARESSLGKLKFDCPQPPVKDYTEDEIVKMYFRESGDISYSVHMDKVRKFFQEKNWYIREKTWR